MGKWLKRALVVTNDDSLVRDEISSLLKKAGFEVVTTPNGSEALSLCRDGSRPVDLAVIDTAMVKTNPLEISECVQEISPRVLLLTDGEPDGVSDFIRSQVGHILPKPFRRAELLGRVLEIMDRPLCLSA
jgi:DNA-binding response OmpR family regulator